MNPHRISSADLHAYLDGELAPDERAEVEASLSASPQDVELARDFRDLNEALRQRYAGRLGEPLPPRLRTVARRVGRRSSVSVSRIYRWVAAVAIVIASVLAGYELRGLVTQPRGPEAQFVTAAIGAHTIYVPEVRHPVEVKADEAHLVRWLAKRVGADVRAPALGSLGWKLMGGRLLPDHGLPAAQFMYEDASGRRLTLYVRKETGLNNTSFRFHEVDGFGSFYWIDRPLAYALSGRLTRDDLMVLANAVYAQLEAQGASSAPGGSGRPQ
jgi:anti-sigma factor RsiW